MWQPSLLGFAYFVELRFAIADDSEQQPTISTEYLFTSIQNWIIHRLQLEQERNDTGPLDRKQKLPICFYFTSSAWWCHLLASTHQLITTKLKA